MTDQLRQIAAALRNAPPDADQQDVNGLIADALDLLASARPVDAKRWQLPTCDQGQWGCDLTGDHVHLFANSGPPEPVDVNTTVDERPSNDNEAVAKTAAGFIAMTVEEPTPTPPRSQEDGATLILRERRGQVEREGWPPEHDQEHDRGELVNAAVIYAMSHADRNLCALSGATLQTLFWPSHWDFKPSPDDRVRELVKAGALIAAEIDRLNGTKPVEGSQERSETGGAQRLNRTDSGWWWDTGDEHAHVPDAVETRIARDAEERARTLAEIELAGVTGLLNDVKADYHRERERATQAEGQREALQTDVERLRTALLQCAAEAQAVTPLPKIQSIARRALSPSTEVAPSEAVDFRDCFNCGEEYPIADAHCPHCLVTNRLQKPVEPALSPSTEATPSEEK